MKVPLVDLRRSLDPIKEELFAAFETTLDQMNLFLGPNVREFEREFAAFCEVEHGIGVSSGTAALSVALRALGIGPDDEVIVPSHTFFATIEAIVHTGATPVMVDIEPQTMLLDPALVENALTSKSRAILPVHLYGHPADMDPLLEIARERKLFVVEDCAQAHGARYRGKRCGSLGDAAAFSFYFTKNLGAYGEAGFVTTRHAEVAERVRQYRHHGQVSKFEHGHIGDNLRLDELQAVVLRLKLPRLDESNRSRARLAQLYTQRLQDYPIELPSGKPHCEPVHHVYPIRVEQRDAMRSHLEARGVGTGIHYKIPGHLQPALAGHPHRAGELPVTEEACRKLLSLPMYPELTEEQLDYVATCVQEAIG